MRFYQMLFWLQMVAAVVMLGAATALPFFVGGWLVPFAVVWVYYEVLRGLGPNIRAFRAEQRNMRYVDNVIAEQDRRNRSYRDRSSRSHL